MPEAFDPYHKWLGIPPEEQPPNYYRLLAVKLFEDDPDVIDSAADQRMSHLQRLENGPYSQQCLQLLAEVSNARVSLLDPDTRVAYDEKLRQRSATVAMPPRTTTPSGLAMPPRTDKPPEYPEYAEETSETTDFAPDESAGEHSTTMTLRRLGEYQLLEKLGQGGMGSIYKAVQINLRREVAVKVIREGRLDDPRALARFEREMAAVGSLDHPNIVRAHDAREIEGTRFLVMEYVDGLNLTEVIISSGSLSVADACKLICQAAVGLQAAHEHGLVHRDIKPSNLMLNREGQIKILDLGLARFQKDEESRQIEVTGTNEMVGTPDYVAPEQIAETRTVDIRADIYSLGCTLYALLVGHPPFRGPQYRSKFDKITAHVKDPVPPISQFRLDVPEPLVGALDRMLAKEPEDRFSVPAEVAGALGPFTRGSDLRRLLATVEGKTAAGTPQSLHGTDEMQSSAMSGTKTDKQPVKKAPVGAVPGATKAFRMVPLIITLVAAAILTLIIGLVLR